MKILEVFPEVDLYWLLNGIGDFPKKEEEIITSKREHYFEINKPTLPLSSDENLNAQDLFSEINSKEEKNNPVANNTKNKFINSVNDVEDEIERIVFFYKNGTFKVYHP
jgi:hypothetical protein